MSEVARAMVEVDGRVTGIVGIAAMSPVAPASTVASPVVAPTAHRAAQLAGPFAAIGLVGGGLVGTIAHQTSITTAFALVTALTASVLGAWLTHHKRKHGQLTGTRLFFTTLLAGMINGAILMLPAVFPVGSLVGALTGCFFAVPFVPALALAARWGDDVGKAREGSIVDAAHRRGPIAAAAMSIAFVTLVVWLAHWRSSAVDILRACAVLAVGVLAIVVARDAFALALARRVARSTSTEPLAIDFGVGDDVTIDGPPPPRPYRAAIEKVRVCGGEPALAHVALKELLLRHSLALAVGVLTMIAHLAR